MHLQTAVQQGRSPRTPTSTSSRTPRPPLSSPINLPLHASTLSSTVNTPLRHSHPLSVAAAPSASLLLMPSWSSHSSLSCIGFKLVIHFLGNSSALNLPRVHAVFVLFSSLTG
ncbi:hypothetical protein NL676_026045 [Syzygium grande]|nr:hypothetical protein NL676_026045 [Syzygium grande]